MNARGRPPLYECARLNIYFFDCTQLIFSYFDHTCQFDFFFNALIEMKISGKLFLTFRCAHRKCFRDMKTTSYADSPQKKQRRRPLMAVALKLVNSEALFDGRPPSIVQPAAKALKRSLGGWTGVCPTANQKHLDYQSPQSRLIKYVIEKQIGCSGSFLRPFL